jgi:hypothetical protein
MLNYFVMGYPARIDQFMGPGNANPVYSSVVPEFANNTYSTSGYFVWTKSLAGFPWDIKTYDKYYIYDRSTELGWNDPTGFKRWVKDLPLARRCVSTSQASSTIRIPAANTNYKSYSQCNPYQTQALGYIVNSISAPTSVNVGNVGSVRTRYLTYKYSCDQYYNNCKYKEVFSLGQGIGLFDWKYYLNKNGTFVLQQESVINNAQGGQTTPSLPCTTSYQ